MSILAYIEHAQGKLTKGSLVTIFAALRAKEIHGYSKVTAFVVGDSAASAAAQEIAKFGVDEVVFSQNGALEPYRALPHAKALAAAVQEIKPELVLALSSSRGKDLFPRVAQAIGAAQISDCLEFLPREGGTRLYRRPMYAGNILATVEATTPVVVVTVRQAAFDAAVASGSAAPVRELNVAVDEEPRQQFVGFETVKSERPELTDANVVISGGRALKSAENFETVIAPLADALGAAIGASRAAVDSGYAPNDWQVGQTGKVVSPSLYIAVGISGAIQHLAGMKDSKVIVAINKDAEAPIFEVADYGLVGDLFEVVPKLTEEIRRIRGS